ncbi:hypothetical protein RhiirA5_443562 [Rhizophagus irregularis]|uniref:Uncharacterized protein n=1 Tax=Rhizophagus irregularis TaxID=588596 RepID=A0A2N0NDW3_9GLOM|nr:hypothetical protein RhiirA5_443562 [Rhizophagus irregularis]
MICRFKANIQIKNDAAALVEYLVKLHAENPEWYFKVDFESIDNRLSKIFWMSPEQKKMWYSRIVATAIVCDETVSTYEWILEQTKNATGDLQPATILQLQIPRCKMQYINNILNQSLDIVPFIFDKILLKKLRKNFVTNGILSW